MFKSGATFNLRWSCLSDQNDFKCLTTKDKGDYKERWSLLDENNIMCDEIPSLSKAMSFAVGLKSSWGKTLLILTFVLQDEKCLDIVQMGNFLF